MIIALPFPILVFEIIAFWLFVDKFGFLDTLMAYFIPTLIGILLLSIIGKAAQLEIVAKIQRGQKPEKAMLGMLAQFIGAIALLPPFITARVVAIILLLPGMRHLALWATEKWLLSKFFNKFSYGSNRPEWASRYSDSTTERDAQVIDITPDQITHVNKDS